MIAAARRLARRADIVFVIAGDGPAKPALAAQVADLPNVRLLPFQPDARLSEFLASPMSICCRRPADAPILCLPSKLAGMLASGRRIVVAAAAGTELADFLVAAAILTPPGDPAALAGAIERAAREREDDPAHVAARLCAGGGAVARRPVAGPRRRALCRIRRPSPTASAAPSASKGMAA